jgi:hypothetical protein
METKSLKLQIIDKTIYIAFFLLLNLALTSVFADASSAGTQITKALNCICGTFNVVLPTMAFVLFVLSGLAYAAGQFFGAETRAKAIGYAMNMITGAIIALILSIIGPTIVSSLIAPGTTVNPTDCSISACGAG